MNVFLQVLNIDKLNIFLIDIEVKLKYILGNEIDIVLHKQEHISKNATTN